MSNELIINDGVALRAELDTQITTAKMYPRDVEEAKNTALMLATMDNETAESCGYCLPPRKDQQGKMVSIKGPSIRLAEIMASCWGNLHVASRMIANDGKHITVEGVAWDLQRNVKLSSEIKRSICTKDGRTYGTEMQGVTANAATSIAIRNAIYRVIPKSFVNAIYEKAMKHALGPQETRPNKVNSYFNYFSKFGIQSETITNFFGKKQNEFNDEDLESLIGFATAVKDNMITVDKVFILEEETETQNPKERLKILLEEKNKKTIPENTSSTELDKSWDDFNKS